MNNAVAVGVFDGLHLGHVEIVRRLVAEARVHGGRSIVISFDPHPDLVLAKSFQALPPLTPLPERRQRLTAMGVDEIEVLPFTRELASLSPEAFVDQHLVRPYRPRVLVVGADFALGRGRAGDVSRLTEIGKKHGFDVESVALLERDGGPVDSTRIRGFLARGQVAEAARLLGRWYALGGTVVAGEGMGRVLGVPTANLRPHEEKCVPSHGIYAVWVHDADPGGRQPGAMSIGVRPTFGGQVPTLEVHLLDWRGELVGRDLEVEFVAWLRPELKFNSARDLSDAMAMDLAAARRILSSGRLEASCAGPQGRR